MHAGLIADLVVILIVVLVTVVCTKRGFMRSVLQMVSNFVALLIGIFAAKPLGNFLNAKLGWLEKVENWSVPLIPKRALYFFLVGLVLFVLVRLLLILLDRVLKILKDKISLINAVDRILGGVFGVFVSVVILSILFMLISALNLQNLLQLTAESGGLLAFRLYNLHQQYLMPWLGTMLSAVSAELGI